jgi:hypothetical protein
VLAALVVAYVLLAVPAYTGPSFLWPFSSELAVAPLLSIYLLHHLGVPGLLQHRGACGWGLCGPTAFGWCVCGVLWVGVAWLVAWRVTRPGARARRTRESRR